MIAKVGIHRFAGGGTLLIYLLAGFIAHPFLPRQDRLAVTGFGLQFLAACTGRSGALGRHEQFHILLVRLFDVLMFDVATVQQVLLNLLPGAIFDLLAHRLG